MTRKEKQIAALRQRLFDMVCGALGGVIDTSEGASCIVSQLGAERLERFLEAVKWTWFSDEKHRWRIGTYCISVFTDLQTVAEWLEDEIDSMTRVDRQDALKKKVKS